MGKKKISTKKREERRINSNLKQSIRRAEKNKRPLRIGTKPNGKPLMVKGKEAQKQRIRIAKAGAEYEKGVKVDHTRQASKTGSKLNIKAIQNMNFSSRQQYNQYMKWKSPQAQSRMLNDKGNSLRQSFRTRAESIGVSEKIVNTFEKRFKELSNKELLAVVNQNIEGTNITFDDIFFFFQDVTDIMVYKQLQNMYRVLGMEDEMEYISNDDVGTEFLTNENWVDYDFEQEQRKQQRRSKGMP